MLAIFKDALIDTLKLIPFLFISFIIMELIEHKITNKKKLTKLNKFGPLAGSALGIIPQCGFGALASNLYAARVISLGTLISIYLSTSDEMIPIMLSEQTAISKILPILLYKFLLGLFFGLLIDIIYHKKISNEVHQFCEEEHCHCEKEGIIKPSIIHTFKIALFIFIVNFILNGIILEFLFGLRLHLERLAAVDAGGAADERAALDIGRAAVDPQNFDGLVKRARLDRGSRVADQQHLLQVAAAREGDWQDGT